MKSDFTPLCALRGHQKQQKGVGKVYCETCPTLLPFDFIARVIIVLGFIAAIIIFYLMILRPL